MWKHELKEHTAQLSPGEATKARADTFTSQEGGREGGHAARSREALSFRLSKENQKAKYLERKMRLPDANRNTEHIAGKEMRAMNLIPS